MTSKKQQTNQKDTITASANLSATNVPKKLDESYEEYTEEELRLLDKYKAVSNGKMDDDDIYDLIVKHNKDDAKIRRDIDEFVKLLSKKGDDYGWKVVEGGKSKFKRNFFKQKIFMNNF